MKEINKQLTKAAAIGVAATSIDFLAVTTNLHRSYTHKTFEMNRGLDTTARFVIWGTGTKRRAWAAVHRQHHEAADTPEDPHSPVQEGKWGLPKLWVKNTPKYTRTAKAIDTKDDYPPDLQPDALDSAIFDKGRLGLAASLVGHMAINKLVGNPAHMGVVSFAVEKLGYVAGGNTVNAFGHSGSDLDKALREGKIVSNPDGTYGSDNDLVALLTLGEGRQKTHHEHPEWVFFGENPRDMTLVQRARHDLGGTVSLALIDRGYGELGQAPPDHEPELAPVIPLFKESA